MSSEIIQRTADLITLDRIDEAKDLVSKEYPFIRREPISRKYTKRTAIDIYIRDGFIDRYKGSKLIYPGALILISNIIPETFPWHPNGKLTNCHIAHWELIPSLDHIVPVTRGGVDEKSNYLTTSMLNNAIKSHWLLDEIGWEVQPKGSINLWDGLFNWFHSYLETNTEYLGIRPIKSWFFPDLIR